MGCGIAKPKKNSNPSLEHDDNPNNYSNRADLLLRYQSVKNVYKIKLLPPNPEIE
jgi:hypothetical protein